MSELRERARRLQQALTNRDTDWQCCLEEDTGSIEIIVQHLEAFAKAEQITGMEAARRFVAEQGHHAPGTILARLDAEIAKLKEGK